MIWGVSDPGGLRVIRPHLRCLPLKTLRDRGPNSGTPRRPSEHTDRFFEQPHPYCDAAGRRAPVNSGPTVLAIALVAVGSQTLPAYCRMRVNR